MPPYIWTPPDASDVPIFSNNPLYVFRCRNLALIFFSGMHVLHLGGMWTPPVYFHTPMHSDAPNAPLYVPNASLCICMFWGYLNRNGGCGDPPSVLTPPCVGCLHIYPTPPHIYMLPCMSVFQDHNTLPNASETVPITSFKTTPCMSLGSRTVSFNFLQWHLSYVWMPPKQKLLKSILSRPPLPPQSRTPC